MSVKSITTAVVAMLLASATVSGRDLQFYSGLSYAYDDNLYRLPDNMTDLSTLIGPDAARSDRWLSLSAGLEGKQYLARQSFDFSGQFRANRFDRNRQLDNNSGNARLNWNWRAGSRLSGTLNGEYSRSLVNFADNRVYDRDLLASTVFAGDLLYRLGSAWRLKLTGRQADSEHGLDLRRTEDFSGSTATGGIEYETPSHTLFGWSYRYTQGRFLHDPARPPGGDSVRDYLERGAMARIGYAPGTKVELEASAGYLRREYALDPDSDFSGDVWRAKLSWMPSGKWQTSASIWRELQANQDAESDYFVSRGESLTLGWQPRQKLKFSAEASFDRQRYLLASGFAGADSRLDTVKRARALVAYTPRRWLQLQLSLGLDRRASNRDFFTYDDWNAAAGIKLLF